MRKSDPRRFQPTPPAIRAAGYCRVSTEGQREEKTIEIQEQALRTYATANGLALVAIFRDEAVSGGREDRPGLADLFQYLKDHPDVSAVLIYRLDRLARDLLIQEGLFRDLSRMGRRLISTMEPDLDGEDPTRRLFRQMMGAVAEWDKWNIVFRLRAGRRKKAKEGGYAGGSPAMGYRPHRNGSRKQSKLKISTEESAAIREIFRLRGEGKTLQEIADYLIEQKVKPRRGRTWYRRTVKYLLENPIYSGRIRYEGAEEKGIHPPLFVLTCSKAKETTQAKGRAVGPDGSGERAEIRLDPNPGPLRDRGPQGNVRGDFSTDSRGSPQKGGGSRQGDRSSAGRSPRLGPSRRGK